MIYIASPYTHKDANIMQMRANRAERYLVQLLRQGEVAFSPIQSCHQLALDNDLPTDFEFWQNYCLSMVDIASELHVIMMDGWKESIGVQGEIKRAMSKGIGVRYIHAMA